MKVYNAQRVQLHFIAAAGSGSLISDGDRVIVKILDGDLKGSYAIVKWGTGQELISGKRYVKILLCIDNLEILYISIGHPKLHLEK